MNSLPMLWILSKGLPIVGCIWVGFVTHLFPGAGIRQWWGWGSTLFESGLTLVYFRLILAHLLADWVYFGLTSVDTDTERVDKRGQHDSQRRARGDPRGTATAAV